MTGKTLLHYEILEKLGEGGMGVVYKARDTHLDRFVAIKVLPAEHMADLGRKRRFVQEAKAASALNHPHIITVHDICSENGVDFMVMEYVRGTPLDELIPKHGMRVGEALKWGIQIADALVKAHAAGIVHRDLKPANIMITDDHRVKVLDFGLAKLTERAGTNELESTLMLGRQIRADSEKGSIVGTPSYMSPEQAEGKELDGRSDIFSFGAVLYEMLFGHRAFQGDSNVSTLAAVLKEEPKAAGQPLPKEIERVVGRCLRKDPNRRFQTMADLKVALEELKEESDSGSLAPEEVKAVVRRRRPALIWITAGIVAIAGTGLWLGARRSAPPEAAPRVVPLSAYPGSAGVPSFSPDGNQVAFHWDGEKQDNLDIYVKLIDSATPLRLTTDPAPDFAPAWSPDGKSIAFERVMSVDALTVMLVPAIGGPEREIGRISNNNSKIAWSPDGKWLAVSDRSSPDQPFALFLLSPTTGEKRKLTSPPVGQFGDSDPAFSPDGRAIAFVRSRDRFFGEVYSLSLSQDLAPQRPPTQLTNENTRIECPVWTRDGREIIFAISYHLQDGGLLRIPASGGKPEQLGIAGQGWGPAISSKGDRLAFSRELNDSNIWRVQLAGGGVANAQSESLIASSRIEQSAQYSPDGKRIAFASNRSGSMEVWVCDNQGSHAVQVTSLAKADAGSPRWSPDGRRIAFDWIVAGHWDIYTVSASGGRAQRMTTDPSGNFIPSYSRDGKWLYFSSPRTGRDEIWRMPADGGGAVQVTKNGGQTALESVDGKWLYYTKTEQMSGLWKMPAAGGEETKVVPTVLGRAFTMTDSGIYFIAPTQHGNTASIQFLNLKSTVPTTVLALTRLFGGYLTVSPDNKLLLYTQFDRAESDLMLIENFR